jgi:RNA recognition motif-containing protein
MAKKLYFGNLSYDTTSDGLKDACSPFGAVETATVITDKMSGRSKGFGFVEMSNDEEAQKVIEAMDGKDLDGRQIKVNEARPMEDRPARGGFGGGRNNFREGNRW